MGTTLLIFMDSISSTPRDVSRTISFQRRKFSQLLRVPHLQQFLGEGRTPLLNKLDCTCRKIAFQHLHVGNGKQTVVLAVDCMNMGRIMLVAKKYLDDDTVKPRYFWHRTHLAFFLVSYHFVSARARERLNQKYFEAWTKFVHASSYNESKEFDDVA